MSRRARSGWVLSRIQSGRSRVAKQRSASCPFPFHRRLRIEPLEDRRLLSVTVDTLVDEMDGSIIDGDISLRDAIALAAPGETIDFAPALTAGGPATLTLTLGQLTIAKDLTINGPGANLLTIDASGNDPTPAANDGNGSRVMLINDGTAALKTVAIRDFTLTGGDVGGLYGAGGGAIYSGELVTVDRVTITGNSSSAGGGIRIFGGTMTVTDSTISGNSASGFTIDENENVVGGGGGISSGGTLNLVSSTVSGNTASRLGGSGGGGGGIYANAGVVNINSSTISGNTARISGGGVNASGVVSISSSTVSGNNSTGGIGGGIFGAGTVTIDSSTINGNSAVSGGGAATFGFGSVSFVNSTISGNTASSKGGGILRYIGTLELHHTTVAENTSGSGDSGGGIFFSFDDPAPIFNHSIIANNRAGGIANDIGAPGPAAPTLNADFSLIEVPGARPIVGMGNLIGIDPLLAPLADNGGPTQTHSLRPGSPAADAGDPSAMAGVGGVPLYDQRGSGFPRVVGGHIDIGSYETRLGNLPVDTLVDESDGDFSVGDLSLREAIDIANATARKDTIEFAPALDGGTILLDLVLSSLTVTSEMTIDASALPAGLTIDGGDGADLLPATADGFSLFVVDDLAASNIEVEFIGLTLTGGDTPPFVDGGAINNAEDLTVSQCTIISNAASNFGGGIASGVIGPATLTVLGSTISANTAAFKGGGIFSYSYLVVVDSTISANVAGAEGGGITEIIHGPGLKLQVLSSTVVDNEAGTDGGGIFLETLFPDPKPAIISNSTISSNEAKGSGGGIVVGGGPLTVEHSTITLNKADTDVNGGLGGGIGFGPFGGAVDLSHTIVAANISGAAVDDDISGFGAAAAFYCLIGIDTPGIIANVGGTSLIGVGPPIDPLLGPLADNGGPTMTHALLAGSPAINAGDPTFNPADPDGDPMTDDAIPFDQRGAPFVRVAGGVIDIGAFEVQLIGPALPGDYNGDGSVDAADYVIWRATLGLIVVPFSGADGDGDGMVDPDDYGVWTANFGSTLPGSGSGERGESRVESQESRVKSRVPGRKQCGVRRPAHNRETRDFGLRISDCGWMKVESRGSRVERLVES